MTKLRIDFQAGILEVEGEEEFVKLVYQDYKDKVNAHLIAPIKASPVAQHKKNQSNKDTNRDTDRKPTKLKNKSKESYSIVKDLDLSSKGGKQSLREFYKEKLPEGATSAMECNSVFVYFLQKIATITNITLSHVYSCYKDVGARVPTALRQSLLDTSHRKGWVDTSSFENLAITTAGENYVEQDLPKAVAKSTK